jgi:hypothetical protein
LLLSSSLVCRILCQGQISTCVFGFASAPWRALELISLRRAGAPSTMTSAN